MSNSYSLLSANEDSTAYFVEVAGKVVGQIALIEGGWRYRLDDKSEWSSFEVGSEGEASEFVLVDRGLLKVNANGVVVSNIQVKH